MFCWNQTPAGGEKTFCLYEEKSGSLCGEKTHRYAVRGLCEDMSVVFVGRRFLVIRRRRFLVFVRRRLIGTIGLGYLRGLRGPGEVVPPFSQIEAGSVRLDLGRKAGLRFKSRKDLLWGCIDGVDWICSGTGEVPLNCIP